MTTDFAAPATAVRRFLEAAACDDQRALKALGDPAWHGKFVLTPGDELDVRPHGRIVGPRGGLAVTSVQVFFDDFAVVRADCWTTPAAAIFLLFKSAGQWVIAGEIATTASAGMRRAAYDPATAERQVLDVLGTYYRAVETGDAAALDTIFHPAWHMKNLEGGCVAAEDRGQFRKRIEAGPTRGYVNDRQIADVQIAFDRMAVVRIDKPSTPGVTVFVFFKLAGRWVIVDKAWSAALG